MSASPRVVALGGGHGLAASLSALRRLTDEVTAVVTVADDGGSSGRLRDELGVLPPGDLRMALAALCGDDEWGQTWARVVQHRFRSGGPLEGHAVGNLLIVALWELLDDPVRGLAWMGRLLGATGQVLPMSLDPLDIVANVAGLDPHDPPAITQVHGQVEVATTTGRVVGIELVPSRPRPCPETLDAVRAADWVVLGPGSWFTSVLPHLLVPELATALLETTARRCVVLNLIAQPGETEGYTAEAHLEVLSAHAPDLAIDVVIADKRAVEQEDTLREVTASLGGELVIVDVADDSNPAAHDPKRLADAYATVMGRGRIAPWR